MRSAVESVVHGNCTCMSHAIACMPCNVASGDDTQFSPYGVVPRCCELRHAARCPSWRHLCSTRSPCLAEHEEPGILEHRPLHLVAFISQVHGSATALHRDRRRRGFALLLQASRASRLFRSWRGRHLRRAARALSLNGRSGFFSRCFTSLDQRRAWWHGAGITFGRRLDAAFSATKALHAAVGVAGGSGSG